MRYLLTFISHLSMVITVSASSSTAFNILGGDVTSITKYPFAAALLYSSDGISNFSQACTGAIINNRTVLSAAHCFVGDSATNWKVRVGSTKADQGGIVHSIQNIIIHPSYDENTQDNDVSLLRVNEPFPFNTNIGPAEIPGSDFNLSNNEVVMAVGWESTSLGGVLSELLQVLTWIVDQTDCAARYAELDRTVTDNMFCSGRLGVGGRRQCQGNSGAPLIRNGVMVGISSWSSDVCASSGYPIVNARVSQYSDWILNNA